MARDSWMQSHIRELGMVPVQCQAIEGNSVTFAAPHGQNAYACLLSHLKHQLEISKINTGWQMILEDDVVMLGMPDVRALVRSAPQDATLLQLTTLAGHLYQHEMPLWNRSTNGYYGTQCYLFNADAVVDRFKLFGISTDISEYLHKPLPPIDYGYLVADSYTYVMHSAYVCSFPFAYSDIKLGSLLHEEHLGMHEQGWIAVREHAAKFKNPFLLTKEVT
jgi:hypothetical protein